MTTFVPTDQRLRRSQGWRWRELNPRPWATNQTFSGRIRRYRSTRLSPSRRRVVNKPSPI